MANPNKSRGTRFESAVRDYLNRELGLTDDDGNLRDVFSPLNVRRAAQEGARDVGDIHAVPVVIEAKDVKSPAVPTWLRQAEREAVNAGFPFGVVVHKVRGRSVAYARVHLSEATLSRMASTLGTTDAELSEQFDMMRSDRRTTTYYTLSLANFVGLLQALRAQR